MANMSTERSGCDMPGFGERYVTIPERVHRWLNKPACRHRWCRRRATFTVVLDGVLKEAKCRKHGGWRT